MNEEVVFDRRLVNHITGEIDKLKKELIARLEQYSRMVQDDFLKGQIEDLKRQLAEKNERCNLRCGI
jgi:hypothetical protein